MIASSTWSVREVELMAICYVCPSIRKRADPKTFRHPSSKDLTLGVWR